MDPSKDTVEMKKTDKPAIHIIGLPHTIVSNDYSTCAFTGKVLRFSKMMRRYGWEIHEYSNEGSQSEATFHHVILNTAIFNSLTKVKSKDELYDDDVSDNAVLQTVYWVKAYELLKKYTKPCDIVCHVFGPSQDLINAVPECYHIESGIGYTCEFMKLNYRVFETNAWMHWHYGRHEMSHGDNYHWVIPNYYDVDEWDVNLTPKNYILFFGRIITTKGINTIVEIANRMPEEEFVICGQGDATPWVSQAKHKNIRYQPPVFGLERSEIVGNAKCMLMPTVFIEPFGGSGAEAQLCGVPLIAVNYGAFKENIEDGKSGFLCNTLADWVESIKRVGCIDRQYVADRARSLWSLEVVGKKYDVVFNQMGDQRFMGWYSDTSHKFIHDDPLKNTDNNTETNEVIDLDEEVDTEVNVEAKIQDIMDNFTLISETYEFQKKTPVIPRILHMAWVGDAEQPEYVEEYKKKWEELMPEWNVRLWTNADINDQEFPADIVERINSSEKGAQKADLMKFHIINKYGGIYLDTDIIPHRSLDPLIDMGEPIVMCHDLPDGITWDFMACAFLAAVPNHPVFAKACKLCQTAEINTDDIHMKTGPKLWGEAVMDRTNVNSDEKYSLLHMSYFYRNLEGQQISQDGTCRTDDFDGRFGSHFYAKGW
jgi:glycosyltransferase involved in cell wall biosynthesis/mannosyltransferase OCH1-like enzyme